MTPTQPEFVTHCLDLLSSVGRCKARRMFGGWGISCDGLTFGIIADLGTGERLYLKTDTQTGPRFEAEGGERFVYKAKGKPMSMGYHTAPEDTMESPGMMRPWAQLAWSTAVQAQANKPIRKSRRSSKP